MANERKNLQHSAGRVRTFDQVIESGTGNFQVITIGAGTVEIELIENGATPGNGIDPLERVILVESCTPGLTVATDPVTDTDTRFRVVMTIAGDPIDGTFAFTVDRVGP